VAAVNDEARRAGVALGQSTADAARAMLARPRAATTVSRTQEA
jgi:hypothetical protein